MDKGDEMREYYTLTYTRAKNGMLKMASRCKGFSAFEVLGFITRKHQDILDQINGTVRPDIVKRKVVEK